MTNAQTEARAIARCVRGCATDDQYTELVERIATALREAHEAGKREQTQWRTIETAPTQAGARICALVETEVEMQEHIPALLMGGWRRVSDRDRIVGWRPLSEAEAGHG